MPGESWYLCSLGLLHFSACSTDQESISALSGSFLSLMVGQDVLLQEYTLLWSTQSSYSVKAQIERD